jgi:hypothetical protein
MAIKLSKDAILYRSPVSNVTIALVVPLRWLCAETLKAPFSVYENADLILHLF